MLTEVDDNQLYKNGSIVKMGNYCISSESDVIIMSGDLEIDKKIKRFVDTEKEFIKSILQKHGVIES